MKVQRDARCRASSEKVWKRCLEDPARWTDWDEDIKSVTSVSGRCENGTTLTFEMKDGGKFPVEISNVVRNSRMTFSGSFFCGLAHFQGDVELQGGGADSCTIFYSFEMGGIVGSLFASISKKAIIEGTEKGLENMVKLSEDA